MKRYVFLILLASTYLAIQSCKKYLDEKSSSNLIIPSTPEDLQALLDNYDKINYKEIGAGQVSSDDFFINDADYNATPLDLRRIYTWQDDNLFANENVNDWASSYNKIYMANIILDNIDKLYAKGYSQSQLNNIKGQALFIRANTFFNLMCAFSLPYSKGSATDNLGVPLRLTSDINEMLTRPSLQATLDQVLGDLQVASTLLPDLPAHVLRASKSAAYGLLSRIYLYLNDYERSLSYADSCLSIKNVLLSFNQPEIPNLNANFPFSAPALNYKNPEIIFFSRIDFLVILRSNRAKIDTTLIGSYKDGDNRKKVYFRPGTGANSAYSVFKGSLEGSENLFNGIATDEVYFNKAECLARLGRIDEAEEVLNQVLRTRWDKNVAYIGYDFSQSNEATDTILLERRKSLVMRGLRWLDIKRLNVIGEQISLKRVINGDLRQLPPNDLKYAIAIPESIIIASGMPQNPR